MNNPNDPQDPQPPTINPPVDFVRIYAQQTYSRETIAHTYTATAARLLLASYAIATRDSWSYSPVTEEEAHALAYAPPGYYPGHGSRDIEKHSPYHYEIHRDDLCAAAGSLVYYAEIEKAGSESEAGEIFFEYFMNWAVKEIKEASQ